MSNTKSPTLFDTAITDGSDHLSRLIEQYATGCDVQLQIVDNIVAKFRPILKANGPNYDGPLACELKRALEAAEAHGRWKAENF